jgi:hypothetical protein
LFSEYFGKRDQKENDAMTIPDKKPFSWPTAPVDAPTERRPPKPAYAAPTPNAPPLPVPREPATVFDLLEWAAQRATTADDAAIVRETAKRLRHREDARLTPEKLRAMREKQAMLERKAQEWEATMARDRFLLQISHPHAELKVKARARIEADITMS